MRTSLLGAAAVAALILPVLTPAPAAQAIAQPDPLGEPGKACSYFAPGAWYPKLPPASPRSEPIWAADLSVADENAAGAVPVCSSGRWKFSLNSMSNQTWRRRSQIVWGTKNGTTANLEGDTFTYRTRFYGQLGSVATNPASRDWHLLWQLHGRQWGQWRLPMMAMSIQQGRLVVTGADGRWVQILDTYRDNTVYDVTITSKLSTVPGQGWVSINVNGRQVTQWWVTPYPTLQQGMDMVQHSSGLYHGSNAGSVAGTAQAVYMEFPQ